MATQTRTATQTSTLTKVVYVTRKVQADLLAIVDTYGHISRDYAEKLIHDLRLMLDEEVVDRIRFVWTRAGTNQVVGAYSYEVIAAGVGLVDDQSGGIRYDPTLETAEFTVRIYYNTRCYGLDDAGRRSIQAQYQLSWGPGGVLDFSRGRWNGDRTYSKEGYGLGRQRFTGQ